MEILRKWIRMKIWIYLTGIPQSFKVEGNLSTELLLEKRKEEPRQIKMRQMVTMTNLMILIKSAKKGGITSCCRTLEFLCLTK
jgi:hypothetical protein